MLDKAGLIFRQNLGTVFRDAQLAADGAGCGFAVPREHDDGGNALPFQPGDRLCGFRPGRVADADHADCSAAYGEKDVGFSSGVIAYGQPLLFREGDAFIFKEKMVAAHKNLFSMKAGGNAVGHDVFHLRVFFFMVQALLQRFAHNGPRHAVGEVFFQACCRFQDIFPAAVAQRDDLRYLRAGGGQRARLVKNDGVRFGEQLHEFPALDHDLARCGLFHGGDDGDGGGELDGAGIIHHQHGESLGDIPGEQKQRPCREQGIGNDRIRQLFRPALDARFQFLRMVDQGDDIVNAGLVSCGVHPDDEGTRFQRGSGKDDGPFPFGSRFRFPRPRGFSPPGGFAPWEPGTCLLLPPARRGLYLCSGWPQAPPGSFSECNFPAGLKWKEGT